MKVLVVDDRMENRMILEAKLKAHGFAVTTAKNGVEALAALRAMEFGLVVTDLMMPQMDGYQLTHTIKTDPVLKKLPVLVYTATYTDAKDEALAMNLGANGFLVKPAGDEEFFSAVHAVIDQARRGELPLRDVSAEELVYLRDYSERLIHKLEGKVAELEATRTELRELNSSLERRIATATRKLRDANSELEAFSYSVSHDLRAPLRAIGGYSHLILETHAASLPPEAQRYFGAIRQSAATMGRLIDDLLQFSQLSRASLHKQDVAMAQLVHSVWAELGNDRSGRNVELSVGDLPDAFGDPSLLRQVWINLLSNALKYTARREAAVIHVGYRAEPDGGCYFIRDNGAGFDMRHADRLFGVFQRLHGANEYEGTGVGLAIVQRILARHGGRIWAEAAVDQGATFFFTLPRKP